MGDPYYRYLAAAADRGIPSFVGLRRDVPVGFNPSSGLHPETCLGAVSAGASIKGYPSPPKDSTLDDQRKDGLLAAGESNILFIDGLPTDCTRREVGHLFHPFTSYKEIKVIHEEPKCSGDRAMVLCFAEFNDSKCAMTAMEALQGYKFDD